MAHWSQSIEGLQELEQLYEAKRLEWVALKHGADGPTGEQNFTSSVEDREAAYQLKKRELDILGEEFARARRWWKEVGESLPADHPEKRTGVKIQDFVDDNGNGIDDREENQ